MSCGILLLLIFLSVLFLAYFGTPLWIWTSTGVVILFGITKWSLLSIPWLIIVCILFLPFALILNILPLRRKLITCHIFKLYRKLMPAMSSTEKEAIDAGTVWWEKDLFKGKPNWNKLLSFQLPKLSTKEKAFIDGPVEELCRMIDDWQITADLQDLPQEVWDFIKKNKFWAMIIPEEYGGLGYSAIAHSALITKISSRSISAAVTIMVPNSLGPSELLLHYGTEGQKDYYLPRLASAEEIPCFGLTGPEAGCDAASTPDNGVVCYGEFDGKKDVLGIRLNWEKRYITLGPIATVLGLAFKLFDPDHLLGDQEEIGITLALIPTNTKGVKIGTRHSPLNAAFQVGPNWGEDVFIPIDWIIGGPDMAGNGWRMLMDCLSVGRSISLPALSAGSSKLASRAIGAYSRIRKQFKMSIGRFEGVEELLARIGGYTYLIDAARVMTTGAVDLGEKPSVASAIVKYHLTEMTRKVINDAMDIQGGAAICMGPGNLLARTYQSIPISITVEGANLLTRNMIIFGQGAIRCHPFFLKEMVAVTDDNAIEFDRAIFGHIGHVISNAVRSLLLGITGSRIARVPGSKHSKTYFRQMARMSAAFAFAADISLVVLGAALKRKERLSARLSDVLSNLYLMSAALKRFEDQGHPEEDLPLLNWACQNSLYVIQESLDGLLKNFPNPCIAMALRIIIFPFGKPYSPPGDKLGHKITDLLMSPSKARDRLTEGLFLPSDIKEPLGLMEETLKKVIAAEPVEKKIRQAISKKVLKKSTPDNEVEDALKDNIISEEEAVLVRDALQARREVIRVDDFPQDRWNREK